MTFPVQKSGNFCNDKATYSPKAVEYSNLDNQNASGLQKRHEENNNIIGSNLNDDIVMSRNDALQSLANLRSECLSNVCYDTQLKRLEREPHDEQDKTKQLESELAVAETKILQLEQALNLHELEQKSKETDNGLCHTTNVSKIYNSELVQTLFRHDVIDLSNITMRNRKQPKQSLEKLIPIVPYNDMENKACDPAGEVSTDYELPLIVNDQHLNISTQNSTLIRHETKESGSRTNPIQKEQSCHYNVPGRQSCSSYLHDRGQQFQSIPVRITHRPLPVNPEKVNKHRRAYRSQVFRHRYQTDWLRHLELVRKITWSQTVSILT